MLACCTAWMVAQVWFSCVLFPVEMRYFRLINRVLNFSIWFFIILLEGVRTDVPNGFPYDDASKGGLGVVRCEMQILIQVVFLLVCFNAELVCSPLFTRVYLCLLVLDNLCFPMFTRVSQCLFAFPTFSYVYSCSPMFIFVYQCLFTYVYPS